LIKQLSPTLVGRVSAGPRAPVVDGRLNDAAWKGATDLGSLTSVLDAESSVETTVKVLVTGGFLYVGMNMQEPNMVFEKIVATAEQDVQNLDHVRILLDPDTTDQTHMRFAIDPSGNVLDRLYDKETPSRLEQIAWTGPQVSAVAVRKDGWSMEISFPLGEIGLTGTTSKIGFNTRHARLIENSWVFSDWQPMQYEDSGPVFGTLVLPGTN
jgi:hypothetical protein